MTAPNNLLNDRYELVNLIGKGGMAEVHQARDRMLERDVSIKILREDYSSDPAFRERFRQEAKAAANLSHSNIVTVHDFGLDDNRLFIVMEYVPGTDLHSMLRKKRRFNIDEGLALIVQACAGIGYAHRAGLVHCDVKPHNFLVTPDNRLKVTDFGIARALASINPDEESEFIWGSPQYFSPEQAAGGAPSPASDVYSLGVVIYRMFTGQLPFLGKTAEELARQHRKARPIPPRELNPFVPLILEEIILKVLSKEPSARYRTADQLGRVLLNFGATSESAVPDVQMPPTTPERPIRLGGSSSTTPSTSGQEETIPPDSGMNTLYNMDWATIGLSLLALIAVGGLIPFWMWVYFAFNPPTP